MNHNTIRKTAVIVLMATLIFLSSCTYTSSGTKEYDLKKSDRETITKGIWDNYSGIKSIGGRITISHATKSNSQRTDGNLLFIRPDSLYIELNGLIGETELKLFLQPDSFFVENYYEKMFIYDDIKNFTMRRMTGINISLDNLKPSLYGYEEFTEDFTITESTEDYLKIKTVKDPATYKIIKLNKKLLIEEVTQYDGSNQIIYQKKFDYFSSTGAFMLPRRIIFKTFAPKQKLTIFYNRLEVNTSESINFSRKQ